MAPLLVILICLILAYVSSDLARIVGFPRVIGQIIAGIILGIGFFRNLIFGPDSMSILSFLANLGIIFLFYYVGLETNFKAFTKNVKRSVMISLFNTLLPLISGFLLMRFLFGMSTVSSLIVGATLAMSAQSVSIDIMEELKILKSKIAGMVISAGAIDDIIELVMVSVLLSIFHFAVIKKTFSDFIFDIMIFLGLIIVARMWFVPFTLKIFDREKSSTSRFMGSVIIALIIAYLSELLGVGSLIGAMIAGMIVRQSIFKDVSIPNWEEHDIARSTHIIAFGFLVPLFFIWVGINTDISLVAENILMIACFILIAIVCTVGGTAIAVMLDKGSLKDGILLGWGLTPKGDVELVIAAIALKAAIITEGIFTALVITSLVTTILAASIFKRIIMSYNTKR